MLFSIMSENRKKISSEQLVILVEAIEQDDALAGLKGRNVNKSEYLAKWKILAEKLNSVEFGVQKTVSKWQQAWRDIKSNTWKKADRSDDWLFELTDFEIRVLKFAHPSVIKEESSSEGIDVNTIADVDPLSSEDDVDGSLEEKTEFKPNMITVYSQDNSMGKDEKRKTSDPDIGTGPVKRQRIQLFSDPKTAQYNLETINTMISKQEAAIKLQEEVLNRQQEILNMLCELRKDGERINEKREKEKN